MVNCCWRRVIPATVSEYPRQQERCRFCAIVLLPSGMDIAAPVLITGHQERAMKIEIGVGVRTLDGHEIGRVERIVVNPDTREVDALVVHRGTILTRDVVVPLSLVERTDRDGVLLRIEWSRVVDLPDFVEQHYTAGPEDVTAAFPYAPGSVLSPLRRSPGISGLPGPYRPTGREWRAPGPEVEISDGTEVRSVDGPIGVVDQVRTDPVTNRVSSIVVLGGIALNRDVEIPVEFVAEVADDHVKLSLTTQQVEELPVPTADRYLTIDKDAA